MTNREAFATALAVLASTFNRVLDPAAIEGYWLALGDLDEGEYKAAIARALREIKFMPTPAELLAFARPPRNIAVEAAEAWEAVKGAIQRYDYTVATIDFGPLVNTVLRSMGSWEWLCEQGEDAMVWRRKDFDRLYEAFASRPEAWRSTPLIGCLEGRLSDGYDRNVRVAIAGKMPPLALEAAPNPMQDLVRKLAAAKSTPPAEVRIPERPPELRPRAIKPIVITPEEKAAALAGLAELEAKLAAERAAKESPGT